jgi:predicted DNA binding CopG/RHH family protein
MEEPMNSPKIPQTDSIKELAQFWDTHDLTDFTEELEKVTEPIFEKKNKLEIYLESSKIAYLKMLAQQQGVNYQELIKEWILEKIDSYSLSKQ